jgi:Uma2 family endonuclease
MSTETLELEGQRVVLHDVSWETYERLLREVKHGGVRLTYDEGELEIMTLGYEHAFAAEFFNQLVHVLTWQLRIKRRSGGSVTMKRKVRKKGLEPDKSFWRFTRP